jgi:hypothetical protein
VNDRTVIVHEQPVYSETRIADDGASSNALIFGIIAVIAIVVIGLFVWQPWSDSTTTNNTTVTTQGQAPADASGNASSTTTTTTTSNGGSTTGTNP